MLALAAAATTTGTLAFLALAGTSGTDAAARALPEAERMLELAGYGLTQVSLTGQRFTSEAEIIEALDWGRARTLLSFDARAAKARIEALPWVERASVERVFPDRVEVHVNERKPFAVWRRGDRQHLIDWRGRVLGPVPADAAPGLLQVSGEGAAGEAGALHGLLAGHPALMQQLSVAERIGERRWTLRLRDGSAVLLPADGLAGALSQAAKLIDTARAVRMPVVDLRVAGRALLRAADGSMDWTASGI